MLDYSTRNKKELQAAYVYRPDRLSRQTSDYLAIRKRLADYNIAILSATEPTGNSPTEKLLVTLASLQLNTLVQVLKEWKNLDILSSIEPRPQYKRNYQG